MIAAAREHSSHRVRRGNPLTSPKATTDYLALKLGDRDFESFCCLFLDSRNRLIEFVEFFRGTIDGTAVHPREVVREALRRNAPRAACLALAYLGIGWLAPAGARFLASKRQSPARELWKFELRTGPARMSSQDGKRYPQLRRICRRAIAKAIAYTNSSAREVARAGDGPLRTAVVMCRPPSLGSRGRLPRSQAERYRRGGGVAVGG